MKKESRITVESIKVYETFNFIATNGDVTKMLTLDLNYQAGKFTITQRGEEGIRFDRDSVEDAELKIAATEAAIKYLKSIKFRSLISGSMERKNNK